MTTQPPATTNPRLPRRGDLITISDGHWQPSHYEVTAISGPFDYPDDRDLYGHVPGRFYSLDVTDPKDHHNNGGINRVELHNGQLICGRRHPDLPDSRPNHCGHITIIGHTTRPFQLGLFDSE
jgi:hypothetical protein